MYKKLELKRHGHFVVYTVVREELEARGKEDVLTQTPEIVTVPGRGYPSNYFEFAAWSQLLREPRSPHPVPREPRS